MRSGRTVGGWRLSRSDEELWFLIDHHPVEQNTHFMNSRVASNNINYTQSMCESGHITAHVGKANTTHQYN